jgi:asparagine synthase (glutamine-hydrolysing)
MCGIFGAISLEKSFLEKDYRTFVEATDLVSYRGPDSSGYKTFNTHHENTNGTFNIFLGHRRLAIIDLSADGSQPMESNGNYIIFNGEIFNYIELSEELKKKGINFKSNSDTEVILKVYENYGPQGFEKLNGMWAFIILDTRKNRLIVSRDRFSIKPLYYYRNTDRIYLASEIKQIIKFLPSKIINPLVMSRLLHQGILDMDKETFLKDVISLKPKHNLIIDLNTGTETIEKYWDYSYEEINEEEVLEHFQDLLTDSIRIRLRSDVELGAMLSGGLDSSVISVIGNKILGNNFKTYTVVSELKKFSEEKFSDALVKDKDIWNSKLFIQSSDIKNNINKVLSYQDEPFINFIVVAHYTILEKIKNETDITVILNGQGGDEVLAGYLRFFYFNLKNLLKAKKYISAASEIINSLINKTVLMQWSLAGAKRYVPAFRKQHNNHFLLKEEWENTSVYSSLYEVQKANIDKYSLPIHTRYEDRNSMAHSLEIRLPFLDHRLVNFSLNLKASHKIKNGWNKYILRKSSDYLPESIRWRKDKRGFIMPEEVWLKNDFKDDIKSIFKKSLLEEHNFIRGDYFLRYYNAYLNGDSSIHNFDISRVYIAEKWMRTFFNQS